MLSYDDTSALGFPRMTQRAIKSMPNDRVFMTPFNLTNHGTGENIYVFDFKNKWKHGGDRLCSMLYHVLSRIKFKDDATCTPLEKAQKVCPKLILMADNCAENKNNTLFAFLSELVLRGWFSEVEMLFGPVGHTHNGNDAVHHVLNNIAGNLTSVTPAEIFTNFSYSWRKAESRPQPVIMECQYAWKARYKRHEVCGFTNRGIKIRSMSVPSALPAMVAIYVKCM